MDGTNEYVFVDNRWQCGSRLWAWFRSAIWIEVVCKVVGEGKERRIWGAVYIAHVESGVSQVNTVSILLLLFPKLEKEKHWVTSELWSLQGYNCPSDGGDGGEGGHRHVSEGPSHREPLLYALLVAWGEQRARRRGREWERETTSEEIEGWTMLQPVFTASRFPGMGYESLGEVVRG